MSQRLNLRIGLVAAAILTVFEFPAGAQKVSVNYTVVTFRKVAPEKVDAFLAFTKDQTRKLTQARIDAGDIKGWSLLKLTMPYAAGSDYNYAFLISMNTFPDLDVEAAKMDTVFAKVGISRAEYGKSLRDLSIVVSQQIARTRLRVGAPAEVGDYIRVDQHLTPADRPNELYEIEEAVFAPMYKSVIDSGKGLRAWSVAYPVFPSGSELGYSFLTTQTFKDSVSLGAGLGTSMEVFQKVHPERNYLLTMERTRSLDKILKMRIYHVLDTLGSPAASMSTSGN